MPNAARKRSGVGSVEAREVVKLAVLKSFDYSLQRYITSATGKRNGLQALQGLPAKVCLGALNSIANKGLFMLGHWAFEHIL
jgi:hypothetical protein